MATSHFTPLGTTALVTGASSGLGVIFAHRLAERGADLVLVARRQDRLEALAVELAELYGTMATVIPLDLAAPGAVAELVDDLDRRAITVSTLVNNAGFGTYSRFGTIDPARVHEEVALNVAALTDLTRALWPRLVAQARLAPGTGALVNVSSVAAYQPVPFMAVYAATKAYVQSFTEALWWEAKGTGLKVTALAPGPTATEFADVAASTAVSFGQRLSPDEVVDAAMRALEKRSTPPSVIAGTVNRIAAGFSTLTPKRALLTALGRATGPKAT